MVSEESPNRFDANPPEGEIPTTDAVEPMGLEEQPESPKVVDLPGIGESRVVTLPAAPELPLDLPEHAPRSRGPEQLEKARRRQAAYLQSRRKRKKRQVFLSRIRALIKMVMAVALLVVGYYALTTDYWRFSQENYHLSGAHLLTSEHLQRFIQPLEGKSILLINPQELQQELKAEIPLLSQVVVRRHLFPNSLDIAVTEKSAWGVLYTNPPEAVEAETASVEKEGAGMTEETLDTSDVAKPMYLLHWDETMTDLAPYEVTPEMLAELGQPIPLVTGGVRLKSHQIKRYREIAQILNSRPRKARLQYLVVTDPTDLVAKFDGFTARLGRSDSTAKSRLSRLFSVIPAIRERQDEIEYVDLRWNRQVLMKKGSTQAPETLEETKPEAETENTAPESMQDEVLATPREAGALSKPAKPGTRI